MSTFAYVYAIPLFAKTPTSIPTETQVPPGRFQRYGIKSLEVTGNLNSKSYPPVTLNMLTVTSYCPATPVATKDSVLFNLVVVSQCHFSFTANDVLKAVPASCGDLPHRNEVTLFAV